jgi:hypothetical protein
VLLLCRLKNLLSAAIASDTDTANRESKREDSLIAGCYRELLIGVTMDLSGLPLYVCLYRAVLQSKIEVTQPPTTRRSPVEERLHRRGGTKATLAVCFCVTNAESTRSFFDHVPAQSPAMYLRNSSWRYPAHELQGSCMLPLGRLGLAAGSGLVAASLRRSMQDDAHPFHITRPKSVGTPSDPPNLFPLSERMKIAAYTMHRKVQPVTTGLRC